MLSRLYRYGFAAYVGGGFTEGAPHSVLEPACYGMPVAFGPDYRRDTHCCDLVRLEAGFPVANASELEFFYEKSVARASFREACAALSASYCRSSAGATQAILDIIFDSR